jgi:hypothetical protein
VSWVNPATALVTRIQRQFMGVVSGWDICSRLGGVPDGGGTTFIEINGDPSEAHRIMQPILRRHFSPLLGKTPLRP